MLKKFKYKRKIVSFNISANFKYKIKLERKIIAVREVAKSANPGKGKSTLVNKLFVVS